MYDEGRIDYCSFGLRSGAEGNGAFVSGKDPTSYAQDSNFEWLSVKFVTGIEVIS